jgi:L-asparagine transporter-like permease
MISIGGIIGAGLFVGSSAAIASVGPAVAISYLLAGLLVLVIMRALSEMAAARPSLGSFTEYIRLGLGPAAGFVSGWLYWYTWVMVVAIEAIAGATILSQWIPLQLWALVLGLMVLLTGVNLCSARTYGEFEFWFSSIKVAAIVAFIAIAGAFALGLTSHSGPTFHNLVSHGGFAPFGRTAILAGVTTVVFSLTGAEIATVAAAESRESKRIIARMTTMIITRIILFYVLSVFLVVCVVPWTVIKSGSSPFATALAYTHVPHADTIMNVIVLTAVLSCLNSGLYVASRVLFTLAAKGDAPQGAVVINKRRVPARAILIGSSFGFSAVILAVISPDGLFAFLVNASGVLVLIVYCLICCAHLRLRWRMSPAEQDALEVRVWLFPWLSIASVAAIVAVLGVMAMSPKLASQLYCSLLTLAVVLVLYLVTRLRRRRQARSSGPVPSREYT